MVMDRKKVVVCGGGMAGLVAAISAREAGADVELLEKGSEVGGTTALSGGLLWTFADLDELQEAIPEGNAVLQELVFRSIGASCDWLRERGVHVADEQPVMGHGRGVQIDPVQAVAALTARLEELGGVITTSASLECLSTSEGRVCGVRCATGDRTRDVPAAAVVLCTGGFQGNPELVTRYVVPSADHLHLRANPWSSGDGFLAATAVGAAVTPGLECFYGHAMLAPPASFPDRLFRDASQYYGSYAVAVDVYGRRFADESDGTGEEVLNQRLAAQPGGVGWYVVDQAIARMNVKGRDMRIAAILDRVPSLHGYLVVADGLGELASSMADAGVPSSQLLTTITEFNRAVEAGRGSDLVPPRRANQFPLKEPPFYAVKVKAAITLTMGGLAVDERMRVLRRSGTTSPLAQSLRGPDQYREAPIGGLYAAGGDIGNVHHRSYLGSLATALVTGRCAGIEAGRTVTA